jgi:hypothetical protein
MGFACLELFGTRVEQSELKTKSDGVYEMIFWAILCAFVGTNGPVTMMHVGSFTSLADCEKYAGQFTVTTKPATSAPSFSLVCIQSNQIGTTPPHG